MDHDRASQAVAELRKQTLLKLVADIRSLQDRVHDVMFPEGNDASAFRVSIDFGPRGSLNGILDGIWAVYHLLASLENQVFILASSSDFALPFAPTVWERHHLRQPRPARPLGAFETPGDSGHTVPALQGEAGS